MSSPPPINTDLPIPTPPVTINAPDVVFVAFAGQAVNSVAEAVALVIRIVRADSSVAAGEALALGLGLVR